MVGLGIILLVSVLSACETVPPKSQPESLEQQAADQQRGMTERYVGKLTYDQAIEKWGPPTRVVQGIRIISAQWVRHQRSAGTVPIPGPMGPVVDLPDHGDQLDTVFDKETGLLKSVHFQTTW